MIRKNIVLLLLLSAFSLHSYAAFSPKVVDCASNIELYNSGKFKSWDEHLKMSHFKVTNMPAFSKWNTIVGSITTADSGTGELTKQYAIYHFKNALDRGKTTVKQFTMECTYHFPGGADVILRLNNHSRDRHVYPQDPHVCGLITTNGRASAEIKCEFTPFINPTGSQGTRIKKLFGSLCQALGFAGTFQKACDL